MNQWNFVDGEMMREVFNAYVDEPSLSKNVLEIQVIDQLLKPVGTGLRFFISSGFSFDSDFTIYNKEVKRVFDQLERQHLPVPHFLTCFWEAGPRISPLPLDINGGPVTAVNLATFGETFFTKEELKILKEYAETFSESFKKSLDNMNIKFWMYPYSSSNGTIYVSPFSRNIPSNVAPMYRIRDIDLDEWKEYTKMYIDNDYIAPIEITKDDLSVDNIII